MKRIFITALALFFFAITHAQERAVKFSVRVSTDSILMNNYFEVKFLLENADGQNFEAPDFSEDFYVVSGPNFSSSFNMVNGQMSRKMTITYYLEPKETGAFYILPASVEAGGRILETQPVEVMVYPNPDGIRQAPPINNGGFHLEFGNPFPNAGPNSEVFPFNFDDFFKNFNKDPMLHGFDPFSQFPFRDSLPPGLFDWFQPFYRPLPYTSPADPQPGPGEKAPPQKKKRKTKRI